MNTPLVIEYEEELLNRSSTIFLTSSMRHPKPLRYMMANKSDEVKWVGGNGVY